MNRMAAAQLVKAAEETTNYDQQSSMSESDTKFENISSPVHHLIRRHTITAIPSKAIASTSAQTAKYSTQLPTVVDATMENDCHGARAVSVLANIKLANNTMGDTKAYAGSLTMPSTPVHRFSKTSCGVVDTVVRPETPLTFHNTTTLPVIASGGTAHPMRSSNTANSLICGSYNNAPNGYEFSPCKVNFNDFNNDFYRLCSDTFFCGSDTNLTQMANCAIVPCEDNQQQQQQSSRHQQHQSDMVDYDEMMENEFEGESSATLASYQTNISAHVNTLFDQWLMQNSTTEATPATPLKKAVCTSKPPPTPTVHQHFQQQQHHHHFNPTSTSIAGSVSTFRPSFNNNNNNYSSNGNNK